MAAMASSAILGLSGSSLMGERVQARKTVQAPKVSTVITANVKKGVNKAAKGGAPNTGVSDAMKKKDWTDSQGRKGKGYGVYRFNDKYGANVDGYSPIWTPNDWADTGDSYSPGLLGLAAWLGLLGAGLAVSAYLIYSTSAIA
mmetsp:Transcript_37298/g.51752  ORF Transcript_37298/g.51752 Transcript_37298/m.51752 type:complete len:143 (+) Transcript_37298:109-537(+)|eukprot:CAMPEP_0196574226 /NCGR_PEP_ID=MMETSP1081-20130531/3971_1 /TAXON_ID=36882 /ORGANISM="Pyramimonas amylifera, Strain CCMP720" /LENGTH=142 /DNA_ID=CAMNT_0041892181 /DNA_START=109 /DNA_END=537 /DNA_ORIENTATION=+